MDGGNDLTTLCAWVNYSLNGPFKMITCYLTFGGGDFTKKPKGRSGTSVQCFWI